MIRQHTIDALLSNTIQFDGKVTLLYQTEPDTSIDREKIMSFFESLTASTSFFSMETDKPFMLPFLTVSENLLLGIPKKEKNQFKKECHDLIQLFKLEESIDTQVAHSLSGEEQFILLLIRGLILKKRIVIFDKEDDSMVYFIKNLMPLLKYITDKQKESIIIVSKHPLLTHSNYYHQCLLIPK